MRVRRRRGSVQVFAVMGVIAGMIASAFIALAAAPAAAAVGLLVEQVKVVSVHNSSTNKTVRATCPAGQQVIGVGYGISGPFRSVVLTQLIPEPTSVVVSAGEVPGGGTTGNWDVYAVAMCVPVSTGIQIVNGTPTHVQRVGGAAASATCPAGKVAVGAGASLDGSFRHVLITDLLVIGAVGSATALVDENRYTAAWSITAYTICATPASVPGLEIARAASGLDNRQVKSATRSCSAPTKMALGVGWTTFNQAPIQPHLGRAEAGRRGGQALSMATVSATSNSTVQWDVEAQAICADGTNLSGPIGPVRNIDGKCVNVLWELTDNGTPLVLLTCNGNNAQKWRIGDDGTLRALGKCADIRGGSTADGTPIQLWDCNGLWNQVWERGGDGTLRNPATQKCLDTVSQGSADLTGLQLRACDLHPRSQIWTLPVP